MVDLTRYPISGALLLLALSMGGATAHAAGPLEFGAALGTSWFDHRSSVQGPTSFTVRTLRPYVRYSGSTADGWELAAQGQRRFEFYSGRAIDAIQSGSRRSHDRLNLQAVRRSSERNRLSFEGGYIRSHDMLDTDAATIVANGNLTRFSSALGARVEFFEGDARLRSTTYDDDSSLVDSRSVGGSARLVPFRRSIDAAFLGVAASQLDIDGSTALISRMASVGYRRMLAPLISAELEVGAAEARFADGGRQIRPMLALAFERDPGRGAALNVALRARFEGDSAAALALEGRYLMAGGRSWLRAESMADTEGGILRHATRTRRFSLGFEDTLARANILGFEGSYINARSLRGEGEGTDLLRTAGWVMRRIQPWLNARVAASYLREPLGVSPKLIRRIRLDVELIVLSGGFGSTAFRALSGMVPGRAK